MKFQGVCSNIKKSYSGFLKVASGIIRPTPDTILPLTLSLVSPWFDKPKKDLYFKKTKGDSVSFVCGARGFPLEVEWKVSKIDGDAIYPPTCIGKRCIPKFIL